MESVLNRSWVSEIEVQYLRATISDEQRQEFATLAEDTVRRIKSGLFLAHSGIGFPQNPCTTSPFWGSASISATWSRPPLCANPELIFGLFDELVY